MKMEILIVLFIAGSICICVYMLLRGMMCVDKEHGMRFSRRVWWILIMGSIVAAGIWQMTTEGMEGSFRCAWLVLQIYFVSCSLTDIMTCQVYDLFQYLGVAAAGYLLLRGETSDWIGVSIILFVGLQYLVFRKLYGEADTMSFLVAAMAEGALGYDMQMYLLHMIFAYLLLSLTQIVKGNIGTAGKLKVPVPFLPYITVGFWGIVVFGEIIWDYMG